MKNNTKLVSKNKIKTVNNTPTLEKEEPIYGIEENSRWIKRLKKYNPNLLDRLRNWD